MKKILFVVNVDWFFISHRLPLAIEALVKGYEVHIACGISDKKEYLENLGLLNISRSGTGIKDIFLVLKNLIIFHILRTINSEKYYYSFSIKDKLLKRRVQ
ncbi:hypothetical protein NG744_05020 [Aliarcobacter cryaerophilus]|uniref:hypothetical protein n=1 Tax=Aliarcobacter cryaerophilus TaxID=28198 RepID=UPI003DA4B43C